MVLSKHIRREKLKKLAEIEGYETVSDLLDAASSDSVSPAICTAEDCDYSTEMEPDQDHGYCEECGRNTVRSALILAGLL